MTEELFLQGRLEMSSSPIAVEELAPLWGDILVNKILIVVSVLLFILMLKDIIKLTPALAYTLQQKHGSLSLEYNISISRIRNWTALVCIIPFCLIADRYGLYTPDFWEEIPQKWSSVAHLAVFCAFYMVRAFLHSAIRPPKMHSEDLATFRHSPRNYFIILVFIEILSCLLMSIAGLPEGTCRLVILIESALIYLLCLIRSGQILRPHCGGLATILYLCGLEMIPVVILAVSAVVF